MPLKPGEFYVNTPDTKAGKTYGARFGLGEHNPPLKGIALELGSNNAVKLSISEKADMPTSQALMGEMYKAGFRNTGEGGINEFVYTGSEKSPLDAIDTIMKNPDMEKFVEGRAEAVAEKEAQRVKDVETANTAAYEQYKTDEAALASAKDNLASLSEE